MQVLGATGWADCCVLLHFGSVACLMQQMSAVFRTQRMNSISFALNAEVLTALVDCENGGSQNAPPPVDSDAHPMKWLPMRDDPTPISEY